MEHCAVKRDASYFEPKPGITLEDLPRFPFRDFQAEMTRTERGVSVAFYLSKVVDHLKGVEDERPVLYGFRSRKYPAPVKIPGLFDDSEKEAAVYQAERKADSGEGE